MGTPRPLRADPARQWSAWVPIAIPLFFIALAVRHVSLYGPAVEPDEGTEAHLFQLLMPVSLVVSGYFALTWLPRVPRVAAVVLAVQLAAAASVFGLVYWLEHPAL
jgi:hypothetical protein